MSPRVAFILSLGMSLAGCVRPCPLVDGGMLHDCSAEWRCDGHDYVARCPTTRDYGATQPNPECVCIVDGVVTGSLGETSVDWCDGTDLLEKESTVDGQCGWNVGGFK